MQRKEYEKRVQCNLLELLLADLMEEGIEIDSLIEKLSAIKAAYLTIEVAIDLLIHYLEDLKDEKDVSLSLDTSVLDVFDVIKKGSRL